MHAPFLSKVKTKQDYLTVESSFAEVIGLMISPVDGFPVRLQPVNRASVQACTTTVAHSGSGSHVPIITSSPEYNTSLQATVFIGGRSTKNPGFRCKMPSFVKMFDELLV